jgi:hypothetical protein
MARPGNHPHWMAGPPHGVVGRYVQQQEGCVPRFYFDVTEGLKFMPDEEGFDLDSLDAAEHEATQTLIQLGRHWLPHAREVSIQVRDHHHQKVLTLNVAMTVERLEPA